MTSIPTLAVNAPAEPASVPFLRCKVVCFLAEHDVCVERTEDIRLAVSEALSNAVLHAYRDSPAAGDLEVIAVRDDGSVEVVVRDSGSGLSPRPDSPGLGLGLPVIARTTDRYVIEQPDAPGGTEIRMRFDC